MREDLHIAIVGATGAVGLDMLKTLEKRNFPLGSLTPLASARSAGKTLPFRGQEILVQELSIEFIGFFLGLSAKPAFFSKRAGEGRGVAMSFNLNIYRTTSR